MLEMVTFNSEDSYQTLAVLSSSTPTYRLHV